MFVKGTTVGSFVLSCLALPLKLIVFLVSLSDIQRYVSLVPAVFCKQVLYDSKSKRLITIRLKSQFDFWTMSQLYLSDCYGIEKLKRHGELMSYYDSVLASNKTPLIFDCGGNIGLAAKYFSQNYPKAKIVLIEPDLTNIVAARQNNVEGDIEFRQIGIGSSSGRGDLVDLGLGNNAFRMSLAETGEIVIASISEILTEFDTAKFCPFIIKIDVEGSEKELFAQNTEWIELFPLLIIELHDWLVPRNGVAQNFLRAISKLDRDFVCFGEDVFSISNKLLGK